MSCTTDTIPYVQYLWLHLCMQIQLCSPYGAYTIKYDDNDKMSNIYIATTHIAGIILNHSYRVHQVCNYIVYLSVLSQALQC